ncbi:MAG: transketolase [Magnetococcales bacterium]|nr:transketolase [Magnetococcales bacterium]MBF0436997.1 transketolase [Magnetococcales bacterium]
MDSRSLHLRRLVARALEGGTRGHLGSALSLVEILRVLYDHVLHVHPRDPAFPERDRLILSKGHGCLALYAILADLGFFPLEELDRFCHFDAILGGHPERGKIPGVEASTGALGHGLSIAVGMAIAARLHQQKHRVFAIMGDGEINEGAIWEAALSASQHRLNNLIAIVDYNKLQSYGPIADVVTLEPLADKWRAFGFATFEVNGHDLDALRDLFTQPLAANQPTAIICHTVKGKGIPMAEHNPDWHHKSRIPPAEMEAIYSALGGRHA